MQIQRRRLRNDRENPNTNDPIERHYTYVGTLLHGLIGMLPLPDEAQLASYSKQVQANTPYRDALLDTPRRSI